MMDGVGQSILIKIPDQVRCHRVLHTRSITSYFVDFDKLDILFGMENALLSI